MKRYLQILPYGEIYDLWSVHLAIVGLHMIVRRMSLLEFLFLQSCFNCDISAGCLLTRILESSDPSQYIFCLVFDLPFTFATEGDWKDQRCFSFSFCFPWWQFLCKSFLWQRKRDTEICSYKWAIWFESWGAKIWKYIQMYEELIHLEVEPEYTSKCISRIRGMAERMEDHFGPATSQEQWILPFCLYYISHLFAYIFM